MHTHDHDHNHGHDHKHDHDHCHASSESHGCCGHSHSHSHGDGEGGFFHTYARELLSGALLIAAVLLHKFLPFEFDWIYFLAALLPVGIPISIEMLKSWREGSVMNEFTLMVAAAAGAFIIGEYPEGVAVLLFYSFGEKMEDTASSDVKRRIKALLGRLPDKATVKTGDTTHLSDPKEVAPGSVLIVKPGERVAIDAVLLGDSEIDFDTSAITGESVPRSFRPGEELMSGMIPVDHAVEVRTTKEFSDSSMTRIMKMIENAQMSQSPTENLLRRITKWYTPVVFILAILLFFIPWLYDIAVGADFEWMKWLRRSLVFLVCSCPCALVVSIPLSYFASLGNASRRGLLFKGSKFVDAMRDIDTVIFDKTGTLTTGKFHVSAIAPSAENSSTDATEHILQIAAAIDAESSHPLAEAITEYASGKGVDVPEAKDVATVPHGMTGIVNGRVCYLGSRKLMDKIGVKIDPPTSDASEICVAEDGRYLGSIYLLDTVKPEAAEAIRLLHKLGIKDVEILSGDRPEAVARVAREIGADSFSASLLPEDKLKRIEALKSDGSHKVAFVGDGINDAPSIAAANVGIAMGSLGTDIAMESSDVVIAGDNLSKIPEAIRLARKVRQVVIENVSFALGVKALVMLLGAFGIASLWAAVFADTGVTLITIMWTLIRLRK